MLPVNQDVLQQQLKLWEKIVQYLPFVFKTKGKHVK